MKTEIDFKNVDYYHFLADVVKQISSSDKLETVDALRVPLNNIFAQNEYSKHFLLQLLNEPEFIEAGTERYSYKEVLALQNNYFPIFGFIEKYFEDGEQVSIPNRPDCKCGAKITDTVIHWSKDKRILFDIWYCSECDISDGDWMDARNSILSLYDFFVNGSRQDLYYSDDSPLIDRELYASYLKTDTIGEQKEKLIKLLIDMFISGKTKIEIPDKYRFVFIEDDISLELRVDAFNEEWGYVREPTDMEVKNPREFAATLCAEQCISGVEFTNEISKKIDELSGLFKPSVTAEGA